MDRIEGGRPQKLKLRMSYVSGVYKSLINTFPPTLSRLLALFSAFPLKNFDLSSTYIQMIQSQKELAVKQQPTQPRFNSSSFTIKTTTIEIIFGS